MALLWFLITLTSWTAGPPAIGETNVPQHVAIGETLEVKLASLPPEPWFPATARVAIRGPSNRTVTIDGFQMTNYTRTLRNHTITRWNRTIHNVWSESLVRAGGHALYFRFTPMDAGAYGWQATLTVANDTSRASGEFAVANAVPPPRGFARIAANKQYFTFQDGSPLYLIGGNCECWDCVDANTPTPTPTPAPTPAPTRLALSQSHPSGAVVLPDPPSIYANTPLPNGTYEFERWFGRLSARGGNYARVWINAPQGIWTELGASGLRHYDEESMWRLDFVLSLASRLEIQVLVSVEMARTEDQQRNWGMSAYNVANGGMLENATEFFTDERAMDAFSARLRYLVARFGHHTSLFAYELFNEANCMHPRPPAEAYKQWHRRMASVIRSADVNAHLVTSSFCGNDYTREQGNATKEIVEGVYRIREMDFAQTHAYQGPLGNHLQDAAEEVSRVCRTAAAATNRSGAANTGSAQLEYGNKPHFWGEFGIMKGLAIYYDPAGWHLHNAIWASLSSLCAGTPGPWWWAQYIDHLDLYHHFEPIAKFVALIDWAGREQAQVRTQVREQRRARAHEELEEPGQEPTSRWVVVESATAALWPHTHKVRANAIASYGTASQGAAEELYQAVVWVQHRNSTWGWRNRTQSEPAALRDVVISLTLLPAGASNFSTSEYTVTWYSTWPLSVLEVTTAVVRGGNLTVRLPIALTNDTAAIVRRRPSNKRAEGKAQRT